jgi:hypothetical protein
VRRTAIYQAAVVIQRRGPVAEGAPTVPIAPPVPTSSGKFLVAGGNLLHMTRQEKEALVAAWRQSSGKTQGDFAAEHGVSARTLRSWLKPFGPDQGTPAAPLGNEATSACDSPADLRQAQQSGTAGASVTLPPTCDQGTPAQRFSWDDDDVEIEGEELGPGDGFARRLKVGRLVFCFPSPR